ncbi:MAG: hypothetical protein R3C97_19170 [Geminicoccaceae bacterium]
MSMKPAGRILALPLFACLAAISSVPKNAQAGELPPASLRCEVLAEDVATSTEEFRLLVDFCEALGIEEDGSVSSSAERQDDAPDYFVRCEVEGDPEWIGFRLVTRRQCEAARGTVRRD